MKFNFTLVAFAICVLVSCQSATNKTANEEVPLKPTLVTEPVLNDSDDPAIWINRELLEQSLIIGTDKGGDSTEGGLHVFDLKGKEIPEKRIGTLKRPNNVDVAYGFSLGDSLVDIAVVTERNTNSLRIFALPSMVAIDGGGIPVFENDSLRAPMGIALYTSPAKKIYAIVGRKNGPDGSYLWQYELKDNGSANVALQLVRKFGAYSGKNEIESIAVDNENGYVYYSDEGVGVRKYYAHPDSVSTQLALFATEGFEEDHEGISIYKTSETDGFILVSDQQANQFHIFSRTGSEANPHEHKLVRVVKVSTNESDGSEITSVPLPGFPKGFFVAMSDDRTFQVYNAEEILGLDLISKK